MAGETAGTGWWRNLSALTAVICLGLPALLAPPGAWLVALAAVVAVCVPVLRWPWGRITGPTAMLVAVGLSLVADVAYVGKQGLTLLWMPFEFAGLLVITGRLIRWSGPRQALPAGLAAVLVTAALPLRFMLRNPPSGTAGCAIVLLIALVPVTCAAGIGMHLRSNDNRRREAVLRARRDQRLQMARVLHDSVAHEVTGMVLEVQAGRTAAYDPPQQQELLERVEQAGLRALDSMDRTLQTLRAAEDDPADADGHEPAEPPTRVYGLSDLPDLVHRFSEASAIGTRLDLAEHLVGALPRDLDETAYALVLESLTNVRRHATAATRVEVAAVPGAGTVRISVSNDGGEGRALHPNRKGGGTGLVGLEERCAMLGGTLTAGATADGWQVTGTLPLPAPPAPRG